MKNFLRYTVLTGCGIVIIGCLLPWTSVTFEKSGYQNSSVFGLEAGGVLMIVYAVAGAGLVFWKRKFSVYPGLLALSFLLYRAYDFRTGGIMSTSIMVKYDPKFGFWLTLSGAVLMVLAGLIPEPKEQPQPDPATN